MQIRKMAATRRVASSLACGLAFLVCTAIGVIVCSCVDDNEQGQAQSSQVPKERAATPAPTGGEGHEARAEAISLAGINNAEQARAKLEELGLKYETETFLEELRQGREDLFQLYMLAGMEIETKGTNGVTPLLAAVFGNNPAIVKELLELGADVLARESESEATSLHYAASGDPLKMMQGGGVSAPTREEVMEFSGIHYEEVNAAAIARLLLEYGADIEARDFAQQTPLFVAAKSGSLEVAKLLLSQGADIEARDGFQATPFMISVLGNNLELMKLLQEHGADIHAVDERGANATWGAVANIKPELLDYTLAQGVSIDIDSKELLPTLHAACGQVIHEGNKADVAKIIKLLLEHGADPNSRDRMLNITPLHGAAQAANPEAIQLLLEYGASVNEIGHSVKATPLHMAASSACVECVKLLLDNGADPGIKDGDGNLPVQIAGAGREQVRKDKAQLEEDLSLSNSQMTKEDRRFFEEKAAAYEEIIRLLESV